ncbi:hypothetical protein AV530_006254 [Patagioenas fasciata monilis]|uniref:Uncharacterized protein n=1 Tax=Patagioenas fasciata monilis TaxID=372326 RepID=A0A1V4KG37_PATFA|nr:hypothetical protein AV530_006254 [Patagioenas fasciata monilis]
MEITDDNDRETAGATMCKGLPERKVHREIHSVGKEKFEYFLQRKNDLPECWSIINHKCVTFLERPVCFVLNRHDN